jgi:hypothetical protein
VVELGEFAPAQPQPLPNLADLLPFHFFYIIVCAALDKLCAAHYLPIIKTVANTSDKPNREGQQPNADGREEGRSVSCAALMMDR